MTPRDAAHLAERSALVPTGPGDWFSGYALFGVSFASSHVLALRHVTASSIGPAYRSVWHREPTGGWTFYATVRPELACARYFGAAVDRNVLADIEVEWLESDEMRVSVGRTLDWRVRLSGATAAIGTDSVTFVGRTPNRHRFAIMPRGVWLVESSTATWLGQDLGPLAPLAVAASLADLQVPQRGLFVVGPQWFDQPAPRERKVATLGRPCGTDMAPGCGEPPITHGHHRPSRR